MNARQGNITVMEMQTALTQMAHSHVSATVDILGMDSHVQVSDSDVTKSCNSLEEILQAMEIFK